ncbi:unnamed protein product [Ectocarpus sp. CCAP 1310/34]|nr:unnamed protein product [Ectocarpus sp. CCAP 1310/34]
MFGGKPPPIVEERALRAKQHRGESETFQNQLSYVHIRRLPLYSELLARLGPFAARELTCCDAGHQPEGGAFRELWLRYHATYSHILKSSVDSTKETSHAGGNFDDKTPQGEAGKVREEIDGCDDGCGDALGLSFKREVETVERALWRRENLGVERGLQRRRCHLRARSRLHHLRHTTNS